MLVIDFENNITLTYLNCHSHENANLKTRILQLEKINKIPAGVYLER